jgi:hypothetical protein
MLTIINIYLSVILYVILDRFLYLYHNTPRRCKMALKVALDRVIPLTQARARLSELVEQTSEDNFWVLTHHGRP